MPVTLRSAKASDAGAILEIYAPIVQHTAISFETEIPDESVMAQRIETYQASHAYLVAEREQEIIGYAYGSFFRPRDAYKRSVEVTVYVRADAHGQGVATRLYEALFESLKEKGFRMALAGIALPNKASVALHRSLGFERVGTFREVGYKFEEWHDVEWWQRPLNAGV